jgi:hypothetical protein
MTEAEARILRNQIEIMWALRHLLSGANPGLVGRGGELDRMRDDLADASKTTKAFVDQQLKEPT